VGGAGGVNNIFVWC